MQITSQKFSQDLGHAKLKSLREPVIIINRSKPKHVLMSYANNQAFLAKNVPKSAPSLLQLFAQAPPDVADIDLDIPPCSTAPLRL